MSAPEKLRNAGQKAPSELTKLKEVWRRMADDARDYWRQRFISSEVSQAEIRKELFAKLKINLKHDSKLTAFRSWVDEQDELDRRAEQMRDDERRLGEEHPDWSKEQIREDVLRKAYLRSRSEGDFKLGLKTIAADAKLESIRFERDRFEFDAAKAALKAAVALKVIASNTTLTDAEKIDAAREALWGKLPEDREATP